MIAGMPATDTARGWPATLVVGPDDRLVLDGVDLLALARERGTPLWAISRGAVEGSFDRLLGALRARYPRSEIAYSMKTNSTMAVIRLLHGRGARLDCSAEHELHVALRAGVPAADVILNGCGKSDAALEAAAALGVREVNVDSLDEAARLDAAATRLGTRVACTVRVQLSYADLLELDPSYERSAAAADKFGSDVASGEAMRVVRAVLGSRSLDLVGLHHHVVFPGYLSDYTAERAVAHHAESARELTRFANEVRAATGVAVERLNLGGGVRAGGSILVAPPGAPEQAAWHELPSEESFAEGIATAIESTWGGPELPLVQLESGSHSVWNAVVLLASVAEVKDAVRRGGPPQRFVYVDASTMMFTIRAMLKVGHPVVPVEAPGRAPVDDVPTHVVGQTCMGDTVAESLRLPALARGDVVALLHQGAYCDVMSTQVNAFPRPETVLLDRGRVDVVKRREQPGESHARDIVPASLWA